MVHPLRSASGLIGRLVPVAPSRRPCLPDVPHFLAHLAAFLDGASDEAPPPGPEPAERVALVSQVLLRDVVRREAERRPDAPGPDDPESTPRREAMRDLLRKVDAPEPDAGRPASRSAAVVLRALAELQERSDLGPAPAPVAVPDAAALPPPALTALAPPLPAAGRVASASPEPEEVPGAPPPGGAWGQSRPQPVLEGAPEEAGTDPAERFVRAATLAPSRGVTRLRLVLAPPDLGELRLDVSLRRKTLHATLQAERASDAEAIRARLPELRAALERRGFTLGELSVNADGAVVPAPGGRIREDGPGPRVDLEA